MNSVGEGPSRLNFRHSRWSLVSETYYTLSKAKPARGVRAGLWFLLSGLFLEEEPGAELHAECVFGALAAGTVDCAV